MIRVIKRFLLGIFTLPFFLIVAELPIRKGYLNYSLADTQYEKLLWIIHQFENGKLRNKHFEIAYFGTSSTLYGINDSITRSKSINLGVNTGSRELELIILERFLENGNSSKYYVKDFHSLNYNLFNYYGLHPVLPYITTPSWLIKKGQSIFQPHFLVFLINRVRVVTQSWIYFHLNREYNSSFTQFGYRPKNKVISIERYSQLVQENPNNQSYTSIYESMWSRWKHNFNAVESFRKQFDQQVNKKFNQSLYYLFLPTLREKFENEASLKESINKLENHFSFQAIPFLIDSNFYKVRFNWADGGHYSNDGAIQFTRSSEKVILKF